MIKKFVLFVGAVILIPLMAVTLSAQQLERGRSGTLACTGNQSLRLGGSEITLARYAFRNFNSNRTITVTEVTIFAANGTTLATLSSGSFPAGFNNVLGPNQSSSFDTVQVFGSADPPSPGPFQVVANWTADAGGLELYAITLRLDEGRNPNGSLAEIRSRDIHRCISL